MSAAADGAGTRRRETTPTAGDGGSFDVGFVGLGALGSAMATALLKTGRPLTVYNRTAARAEPLLARGATWARSAAEVAATCDTVISCLSGSEAVEAVYLGAGGILSSARPGQTFIEHGTFSPATARHISAQVAELGSDFLDVPVTGGPSGAAAGTLAAMAGGQRKALERVRPVLHAYSNLIRWIGTSGRGLELKLINQFLVIAHIAAATEATALLRELSLPKDASAEILIAGWGGSKMLDRTFAQLAAGEVRGTGVTIGGLIDIEDLIREIIGQTGVGARVFEVACEHLAKATKWGMLGADPAALTDLASVL